MEKCLARLKRLKIAKCDIFLFTDNADGERFWQRNGWEKRTFAWFKKICCHPGINVAVSQFL